MADRTLPLLLPRIHSHRLTKLSIPLLIQNLLSFSTTVIAIAFVGHLNRPDLLSSAVLANSVFNVTGYSLMQGLASGMESLCSQVSRHTGVREAGIFTSTGLRALSTIQVERTYTKG